MGVAEAAAQRQRELKQQTADDKRAIKRLKAAGVTVGMPGEYDIEADVGYQGPEYRSFHRRFELDDMNALLDKLGVK